MAIFPAPTGILRPSSASRWGPDGCSGSVALEGLFPELEDTPEAREGTAAHFYVMEYLEGRAWPVGHLTPNGVPIDQHMIEYGQSYIDDVKTELAKYAPGAMFRVETKIFAHSLVHPENEGTPDTFAIHLVQRKMTLWDYKYGHGYVDAYKFWQGINYIAGVWEGLELTLEDVRDMDVEIRVVQPRNYHIEGPVRVWKTTGAIIWALIEQLSVAAYAAKQIGAPTRTGPHCEDCKGRHACAAFMQRTARDEDMAGDTLPIVMPPDAVGVELARIRRAIKRLEARRDGLQEQALHVIRKGGVVKGWRMGFVDSRERWKVPVAEVVLMGAMLGVDLAKPEAKSPAEARRLGVDQAVIGAYSEKPTGAAKLVPADDNAAAKAFGAPSKPEK